MRSMLLANSSCSFFATEAGDEDAEMADRLMNGVNNGLAMRPYVVDALVEIEDPAESLLRRRDVICLRAEDDDRRAYIAQIDTGAIRRYDLSRSQAYCRRNSSSTMNCISSALSRTWPPHHCSNSR